MKEHSALDKSITHHKENLIAFEKMYDTFNSISILAEDCHLCQTYGPTCKECPVFLKTGKSSCIETPYADLIKKKEQLFVTLQQTIESEIDEIKFLESLKKDWEMSLKRKPIGVGSRWTNSNGYMYILASISYSSVALINLESGLRMNNPTDVMNQTNLTDKEWTDVRYNTIMARIEME